MQPEVSAARQAGRALAWVLYVLAVALAFAAVLVDPHGNDLHLSWPWGRVTVAVTLVALIACSGRFARRMAARPRWARPIAVRIAVLAVLLAVAGFGVWQSRQADAAVQRQMLATYTRGQKMEHAGLQRVDELLAPARPGSLTRYANAPCSPMPRPSPEHCWTSPQAMDSLAATLNDTLTGAGAQHLESHCEPTKAVCQLRGEVFGVSVRMFLRQVAAPTCECPAAASDPKTQTLLRVFVIPVSHSTDG